MARHKVRGPYGAVVFVAVPEEFDERTFAARIASGEFTLVDSEAEAAPTPAKAPAKKTATPRKRAPRKPAAPKE